MTRRSLLVAGLLIASLAGCSVAGDAISFPTLPCDDVTEAQWEALFPGATRSATEQSRYGCQVPLPSSYIDGLTIGLIDDRDCDARYRYPEGRVPPVPIAGPGDGAVYIHNSASAEVCFMYDDKGYLVNAYFGDLGIVGNEVAVQDALEAIASHLAASL